MSDNRYYVNSREILGDSAFTSHFVGQECPTHMALLLLLLFLLLSGDVVIN